MCECIYNTKHFVIFYAWWHLKSPTSEKPQKTARTMLELAVCLMSKTESQAGVTCFTADSDVTTCTSNFDGTYWKIPTSPDPNANIFFTDAKCSEPAPTQDLVAADPAKISPKPPTDLSATPYLTSELEQNKWVRMPGLPPSSPQDVTECPITLQDKQLMAKKCAWYLPAKS